MAMDNDFDRETHALIAQRAMRLAVMEDMQSMQQHLGAAPHEAAALEVAAPAMAAAPTIVRYDAGTQFGTVSEIGTQTDDDAYDAIYLEPTVPLGASEGMLVASETGAMASRVEDADEFQAERELMDATAELDAVILQLSQMSEAEGEPGFGEQLLQAARNISTTTSALVLQAAAVRREQARTGQRPASEMNAWTADVTLKAQAMHQAAAGLCAVMGRDQQGAASEQEVLASAIAVRQHVQALIEACAVPEAAAGDATAANNDPTYVDAISEAQRAAEESEHQYAELVEFAQQEVAHEPTDAATAATTTTAAGVAADGKPKRERRLRFSEMASTIPANDAPEGEEIGPGRLRHVGGSFSMRMTMRRKSMQTQEAAARWQRLCYAIEEETGVKLTGVDPENAMRDLPKRLRDGVLVCQLLNAYLTPPGATPAIPVNEPEPGRQLITIRVMENMEHFKEGCRKMGLSTSEMCSSFDIIEGKGSVEVLQCLEAIMRHGRERRRQTAP